MLRDVARRLAEEGWHEMSDITVTLLQKCDPRNIYNRQADKWLHEMRERRLTLQQERDLCTIDNRQYIDRKLFYKAKSSGSFPRACRL